MIGFFMLVSLNSLVIWFISVSGGNNPRRGAPSAITYVTTPATTPELLSQLAVRGDFLFIYLCIISFSLFSLVSLLSPQAVRGLFYYFFISIISLSVRISIVPHVRCCSFFVLLI